MTENDGKYAIVSGHAHKAKLVEKAINNWSWKCRHGTNTTYKSICKHCIIELIIDASLLCGHQQIRVYCNACKSGDKL